MKVVAGQTILWAGEPKFMIARVNRTDGMFIKDFKYEERLKGEDYFKKWIDEHYFNIEVVDNDQHTITYWVS